MSEQRNKFYNAIREKYPVISEKADAEYMELWGECNDLEYDTHSWFEALANVLNKQMSLSVPAERFKDLFLDISIAFKSDNEDVRKCIDVAFVENLYWQVTPEKAESYWNIMPETLQELYVNFHHRTPV